MPLISIVMPAYNVAPFIGEAIQSVRAQTHGDWELIIVDDHSADGTGAVVERYAAEDRRIRLIRRAENSGVSASRNVGLKAAHGRFIAFLDADDVWLPEKLTQQVQFMQQESSAVSYHAYRRLSATGKTGRLLKGPARVTFETLLRRNAIGISTVMVDRNLTGDFTFDTSLNRREDLALWLSLTKAGHDIVFLDADLARYRVTPSAFLRSLFTSAFSTWRVYRHVAGLRIRQTFLSTTASGFFAALKRIG